MRKDFLVFRRPLVEQSEIDEVVESLKLGWLGTGPKVRQFEELFKDNIGSEFAIALSTCTAALHLSLYPQGFW
jgi:dTDP-4-amino-4,6-dideoxygalactose transaminase